MCSVVILVILRCVGAVAVQHPAHWHTSYVNLLSFQVNNESGWFPPMTHAFSGVAGCRDAGGCRNNFHHFSEVTQQAFSLAASPGVVHLQEGEQCVTAVNCVNPRPDECGGVVSR